MKKDSAKTHMSLRSRTRGMLKNPSKARGKARESRKTKRI